MYYRKLTFGNGCVTILYQFKADTILLTSWSKYGTPPTVLTSIVMLTPFWCHLTLVSSIMAAFIFGYKYFYRTVVLFE